ncbi:MAG: ATP synthase F1 subunit gamma [Erysipelotrichaceae bacterium]|nr:ATP synthase F1 subunit gamma [Erysipelotrichaceae bacterium]MBR3150801.1 ATP synthase F1 subunit gamma [Erysipelotrichaceae bacterium]
MAGNQQAIKSRIRSVKSTKKITKAMQMIANAKLTKQRKLMESNRFYSQKLQEMVDDILSADQPLKSKYLKDHHSDSAFTIFFCSDLGLCGGYNANITKFAKQNLKKEDPLLIIGTHGYQHFKREGYNIVNKTPISIDGMDDMTMREYIDDALDLYLKDEINKIQVCYTRFVNTMTFEPSMNVLLPYQEVEVDDEKTEKILDIIFDPSINEVLDQLIVEMVHNVAYSLSLETKTAEQGSRRLAMETATDNAEELEEKLVLQFNQARQAAITQELTEIVGTANAL